MARTFRPTRTERGWEIYDGFAFEPEAESAIYATRSACGN